MRMSESPHSYQSHSKSNSQTHSYHKQQQYHQQQFATHSNSSYLPEYEIFTKQPLATAAATRSTVNSYNRNYASEGLSNRNNAIFAGQQQSGQRNFQVSESTAFRFYSEQKERKGGAADIAPFSELQNKNNYQQYDNPLQHTNDQQGIIQQQYPDNQRNSLNSSISSLAQSHRDMRNSNNTSRISTLSSNRSNNVNNSIANRRDNSSTSSSSNSNTNSNSKSGNSFYQNSSQSAPTVDEDETNTATNDLIYKGQDSFISAISRKKAGIVKDIMFFAFVFIALLFLFFSYQKVHEYYDNRAKSNIDLFNQYYEKNSIFSNLTSEASSSASVGATFKSSQNSEGEFETVIVSEDPNEVRIEGIAWKYYKQFLIMIREAGGKMQKNSLLTLLFDSEPNEWEDIFEKVQIIRKRKEEIQEIKNESSQLVYWYVQ